MIVRDFRDDDIDSVRRLFTEVFHETRPREHFVWKLLDNPAGRGIAKVAEDSGQIVGYNCLMPIRLRIGNDVVLGAQGEDSMTHPDHEGIWAFLEKACEELAIAKGVEVAYGLPNPENTYRWMVYILNWDHTGDVPHWVRVLNNPLRKPRIQEPRMLDALGLLLLPMGNKAPSGINVRRERPTDEELVSLADLVSSNLPARTCQVERSSEWFKWRFDPAPKRRYHWFSAYRDRDLKAWAVLGHTDWGEAPQPPEIAMSGADPRALEAVVSAATRMAKELGVTLLLTDTNDDNAVRALKSCGYVQRGSLPLVVKSFTNRYLDANIHLHSSWRIGSECTIF